MPQCLVVDVNGVGYEVQVPLSTFDALNPAEGAPIMLKIHMHVRENAQVLYGFATDAERDIFRLLIDRVSGRGTGRICGFSLTNRNRRDMSVTSCRSS